MELTKNTSAIKRYGKLMRFANWLQQLPNKVTPPPFRLIQIGSAFWQSRALYVGTKLGIADELGDTEKSITTLSKTLKLNDDHLYRLMRMLASIGVFSETSARMFKNSKSSNYLRKDNPKNVRAMILMHNSTEMVTPWIDALESSIRDGGIPFEKISGVDLFEYMNQHKDFDTLFSQAMDSVENITGTQFLDDFNWDEFTRIIDVGGSNGSKSLAILKAHPGMTATIFDRPQVTKNAKESWKGIYDEAVLDRAEFIGGDMFDNIPRAESNNDIYLFIGVFHGFDDSDGKRVLEKLTIAMGDKSPYVVIADTVASDVHIDAMTASMDMQMLMGTRGRERTQSEWNRFIISCGFKIERILDTRSLAKYIVIRKRQ